MLQAKQQGTCLVVGVHSDEEILANKGPVVMTLAEREVAVQGCRWLDEVVPGAPYVTFPAVMDQHDCWYVVHGDDITTDADGNDCYQEVKDLGRFIVVKRTEGISTTDLVGRMLLFTKTHHVKAVSRNDWDGYTSGNGTHPLLVPDMVARIAAYASGPDAKLAYALVLVWVDGVAETLVAPGPGAVEKLQKGVLYVDGAFDLFHPGHIEALRLVRQAADAKGYAVVAGITDDLLANKDKGLNYPIMSVAERLLCVLQSKYIDGVVIGAPACVTGEFLGTLGYKVEGVYHGPTSVGVQGDHGAVDAYQEVRAAGLFKTIGPHQYGDITTELIVARVLQNRIAYEERQKKKGWKGEVERRLEEEERQRHG